MATLSDVGSSETVLVSRASNIIIEISGTYDMVIAFQQEVGSPGSGVWSTLFTYEVPNATVVTSYSHPKDVRENYRLVVLESTSGSATASLTVHTISQPSAELSWGNINGTLSDQSDLQAALDLKADTSDLGDLATLNSVSATELASNAVTSVKIASTAVTKAKLNSDVFENNAGILTGTATDEAINAAGLTYFRGLIKSIDGKAAAGDITTIDGTHAGQIIQVDQNLTLANTFPASSWVQLVNLHASTNITLTPAEGGELNGSSAALSIKANGGRVVLVCVSNAGTTPACDVAGDLVPVDFDGNIVQGNLASVETDSGTLDVIQSGKVIVTSGNITIPTTAGFNCTLIGGGAHTVTFNSTTSEAMASGDIMSIIVQSSTVIHAVKVASADKVSFS